MPRPRNCFSRPNATRLSFQDLRPFGPLREKRALRVTRAASVDGHGCAAWVTQSDSLFVRPSLYPLIRFAKQSVDSKLSKLARPYVRIEISWHFRRLALYLVTFHPLLFLQPVGVQAKSDGGEVDEHAAHRHLFRSASAVEPRRRAGAAQVRQQSQGLAQLARPLSPSVHAGRRPRILGKGRGREPSDGAGHSDG
jgi:hypothetical protein